MNGMENWLDRTLEHTIPDEVIALAFNLYEDGEDQWSMELVGSNSFDADDPDWVCDEVFATRDDPYVWVQKATWEEILQEVTVQLQTYLETGKYAEKVKSYEGIGVGFVDGEITLLP